MSIKEFMEHAKEYDFDGAFVVTFEGTNDGKSIDIIYFENGRFMGSEVAVHLMYEKDKDVTVDSYTRIAEFDYNFDL